MTTESELTPDQESQAKALVTPEKMAQLRELRDSLPQDVLTVRLKIVDREASRAFIGNMGAPEDQLLHGCRVRAISVTDVFEERDELEKLVGDLAWMLEDRCWGDDEVGKLLDRVDKICGA